MAKKKKTTKPKTPAFADEMMNGKPMGNRMPFGKGKKIIDPSGDNKMVKGKMTDPSGDDKIVKKKSARKKKAK